MSLFKQIVRIVGQEVAIDTRPPVEKGTDGLAAEGRGVVDELETSTVHAPETGHLVVFVIAAGLLDNPVELIL